MIVYVNKRKPERSVGVMGGKGELNARKWGLVMLHGLIHCATEITEQSKSSFNASTEERRNRQQGRGKFM